MQRVFNATLAEVSYLFVSYRKLIGRGRSLYIWIEVSL